MTAWAVRRCGGAPVRITPSRPCDAETLHGLIIGGGTDVDPFHYQQERPEKAPEDGDGNSLRDWLVGIAVGVLRLLLATGSRQEYDPARDEMERSLVTHALYHNLPVLGICRGAQLMNVVLGGTLHQNIEHFYSEETNNVRSILPRKRIVVSEGSLLRDVLGVSESRVNALHDQSIDRLGDGVVISAVESIGVIQAIERPGQCFFLGVQWHPEYMPQSRRQMGLFRELLRSARRIRGAA
jgi:putative glutamine amidotransferase